MFRRFSVNFAIFSIFLDGVIISASIKFAEIIRPNLNQYSFAQSVTADEALPWQIMPLFAIIWIMILMLFSVYDGRKNILITDEILSLVMGIGLAAIASAGTLYLTFRDVSRILFVTFVLISLLLLVFWRLVFRLALRWRGFHPVQRNVLIVGGGLTGQKVSLQVMEHEKFGINFVGFLDDERSNNLIVGKLNQAREIISNRKIDDVVIALPRSDNEAVGKLVADLHDLPLRVWVVPDYFSLVLHKAAISEYAGVPMLDLRAPALNDYQRMVKRVFDIVLTILILPFATILMILVAISIALFDNGSVLFLQNRVGENGKHFMIYKFRTMSSKATNSRVGDVHKVPKDPRITKIGAILRKTGLDELPQLINVLKGEMSLVGPRPELPELVDQYETWQRKRFVMPPGMTGWWQVNGRSLNPLILDSEDDLYYIQNYSLLFDIYIIIRTVWVVITGKGV